jgi:carbonic anhydrase
MRRCFFLLLVFVPILAVSCNRGGHGGDAQPFESASGEHASGPEHGEHASAHGSASGSASGEHGEHGEHDAPISKYSLPFAYEASKDEPLASARSFVRDLFSDNADFMKSHAAPFFKAFAEGQKPRVTVVTCSDSRVQSPAFDQTPENDDFFIRNIGNQVTNSQGSVEYGVHHLKTSTLLILGHTGCGAIKAAMGDFSKESPAIKRELTPLVLPKRRERVDDNTAWLDGVVANVNSQVSTSLQLFAHEVAEGKLTVIGAVYDFRNDMKQGYGKVVIINVNGQTETPRLAAFAKAVGSGAVSQPQPPISGSSSASPRFSPIGSAIATPKLH